MRNLQPADERKSRDIFTAVRDLGKLALEEANVRLEAVTLPHFDGEEMMVVLLSLLARGILSEKRFAYLLKVAERVRRQRVEPIRCRTFRLEGKVMHKSGSLRE